MIRKIEVDKTYTLLGHQNPIYAVEIDTKTGTLFTAGNDKGVVQWDLSQGIFTSILLPVKTSVYSLHLIPKKRLLAVGERSGEVSIVDIDSKELKVRLRHHKKPVFAIQHLCNAKSELLLGSEDGTVSVWSLDDFSLLYRFNVSSQTVRCFAKDPKEEVIALGCKDHIIRIYDSTDYSLLEQLSQHHMPITALSYSPDGKYLLSAGRDAQLNVFNKLEHYKHVKNFNAHLFSVYAVIYHPSLPLLATVSRDKSIKIWRSEDFSLIKVISIEKGNTGHKLSVNNAIWTDDHLITVSDDKTAIVWRISVTE